jgi:ATP/maltotriose-dependent transcriptional regulator MalT
VILKESGQVEDAASLLCKAGLWTKLVHLIGQHAFVLINEGRTQTLKLWLRCLPHQIVEQNA